MLAALLIALLFSFSYKLVDYVVRIAKNDHIRRFSIYVWAIVIVLIIPLVEGNYVFKAPVHFQDVIIACLIIAIAKLAAYFSRQRRFKQESQSLHG